MVKKSTDLYIKKQSDWKNLQKTTAEEVEILTQVVLFNKLKEISI